MPDFDRNQPPPMSRQSMGRGGYPREDSRGATRPGYSQDDSRGAMRPGYPQDDSRGAKRPANPQDDSRGAMRPGSGGFGGVQNRGRGFVNESWPPEGRGWRY